MPKGETAGPWVIDLFAVKDEKVKRFVVATVLHQLVELRSGNAVEGLRYLVTLDELNRFAPKSGSDPITEMIERVAAEMRSQGIILLGAQQEASRVSSRVIENAGIKAVGRSGSLELSVDVWKSLGTAARTQAAQIMEDEKLTHAGQVSEHRCSRKSPSHPGHCGRKRALLADDCPVLNLTDGSSARPMLTAEEI